jgi:hypothetical protein
MEERKANDLCFNCDKKYSKGHKCGEKKLFYVDFEEEEEQEPSQDENVEVISFEELTLVELHTSLVRGHSGFLKTYNRVKKEFFGMALKLMFKGLWQNVWFSNKIRWKQLRPQVFYNH